MTTDPMTDTEVVEAVVEEGVVMIVDLHQEHIRTRDTMAVDTVPGMETRGMIIDMTIVMP